MNLLVHSHHYGTLEGFISATSWLDECVRDFETEHGEDLTDGLLVGFHDSEGYLPNQLVGEMLRELVRRWPLQPALINLLLLHRLEVLMGSMRGELDELLLEALQHELPFYIGDAVAFQDIRISNEWLRHLPKISKETSLIGGADGFAVRD